MILIDTHILREFIRWTSYLWNGDFAYSHHGTDPVSGRLCNAFDLVRLHKFGDLDIDAKDGTPVAKLPSYLAMQELATEDTEVKKVNSSRENVIG